VGNASSIRAFHSSLIPKALVREGQDRQVTPRTGFAALATKSDLESLEHRLTAKMEQLARRLVMWTSTMVLASAALASPLEGSSNKGTQASA
jgi:hypothetical protein